MTKIPLRTKLLIAIGRKLVDKARASYKKRFQKDWPIVLVAGTAGKSSTTLLIQNMFVAEGWQVYGSATKTIGLNSLTGLIMVMGNFFLQFEGGQGSWHKLEFLIEAFWAALFTNYNNLQEKSVLVFEVGFNEQDEADFFTKIFEGKATFLAVTNLTLEHSFGFSNRLDAAALSKLEHLLPQSLGHLLLDSEKTNARLANTALEQLKLLTCAKYAMVPTVLGIIENSWLSNYSGKWVERKHIANRVQNRLEVDNRYLFPSEYLLPLTFAKTVGILEEIKQIFKLQIDLQQVLDGFSFPNGRFSLLKGVNNTVLVDSTYNSDPASLISYLDLFEEILQLQKQSADMFGFIPKHNLILGEMRELGKIAKVQHALILDRVLEIGAKFPDRIESVKLIGKEWLECNTDHIAKVDGGAAFIRYSKHFFKVFDSAKDIIDSLPEVSITEGNWFWLKGSQNTIYLEGVTEYLLEDKSEAEEKLCRRGQGWTETRSKWLEG